MLTRVPLPPSSSIPSVFLPAIKYLPFISSSSSTNNESDEDEDDPYIENNFVEIHALNTPSKSSSSCPPQYQASSLSTSSNSDSQFREVPMDDQSRSSRSSSCFAQICVFPRCRLWYKQSRRWLQYSESTIAQSPIWEIPSSIHRYFFDYLQKLIRSWKDLSPFYREKILFIISTLIGTILFFILFELLFRLCDSLIESETSETAFTISYVSAYLISILWQHGLNRYLIFRGSPFCSGLLTTYLVYSSSLFVMTLIAAILISLMKLPPRLVTAITLPTSGFFNYVFLNSCLNAKDVRQSRMGNSLLAGSTVGISRVLVV